MSGAAADGTTGAAATWVLLDYGVGNLHSLQKALERVGARTVVTEDPADLVDADIAVLPGVGAFGHVMDRLEPVRDALRERHEAGRPTLGICIGMQVLYEGSDEAPGRPGLGILPGTARRLEPPTGKVPHMGWNTLDGDDADPVVGDAAGRHVYYVHSYAAPAGPDTLATTTYGAPYAAAVRSGSTLAFQFHPEKSSTVGHGILKATRRILEDQV